MWKRLIAWLDRDVAVQHLARLDDRMLADIGVERDGLRAKVMGRAKSATADVPVPQGSASGPQQANGYGPASHHACLSGVTG